VQHLSRNVKVYTTVRRSPTPAEADAIFGHATVLEGPGVEDFSAMAAEIERVRPAVVINAVGLVKQDPESKNVIKALTINAIFPHRLSELGKRLGFRLITISTDCVFDGRKGNYRETDLPDAMDLYGLSKRLGEVVESNCLTLRTSIIGRNLDTRNSLVEWFLANRGGAVPGYSQAYYSGFPTIVMADIIEKLIVEHPNLWGIYHVSSEPISKLELLELLNKSYAANISIEPSTEVRIDRSLDSARFRSATGFQPASWPEMVDIMAGDPTPYDSFSSSPPSKIS
jgi:dTDP-4-dehydrorhamnose reductase